MHKSGAASAVALLLLLCTHGAAAAVGETAKATPAAAAAAATVAVPSPVAAACPSVATLTSMSGVLGTLLSAAKAAGLAGTLSDPSLVATVFGPTDDAFTNLLSTTGLSAAQLFANTDILTQIIKNHVVPSVKLSTMQLRAQSSPLPNLLGQSLQVAILPPSGIEIIPSGGAPGTIVLGDLPACNAVVHIVDRVLLPTLSTKLPVVTLPASNTTAAATAAPVTPADTAPVVPAATAPVVPAAAALVAPVAAATVAPAAGAPLMVGKLPAAVTSGALPITSGALPITSGALPVPVAKPVLVPAANPITYAPASAVPAALYPGAFNIPHPFLNWLKTYKMPALYPTATPLPAITFQPLPAAVVPVPASAAAAAAVGRKLLKN